MAAAESDSVNIDSSAHGFASMFQNIWDGLADAMVRLGELLPRIVAALLVAAIGFAIARWAARLVARFLERLGLQRATEHAGIDRSLRNAGVKQSVTEMFGAIVFFSLLAVFLSVALHLVGVTGVSAAVDRLVAFLPRVMVAAILLIVGLLGATLVRGIVVVAAANAGVAYAETLAAGIYYTLAVLTGIAAFEQLEIRFALLNQLIAISFAAVAFGAALSVGLGARDMVAGCVAGYWLRQQFQSGDLVRIDTLEARVRVVGPMSTIVETDDDGLVRRHTIPNAKMIREAILQ